MGGEIEWRGLRESLVVHKRTLSLNDQFQTIAHANSNQNMH